MIPEEWLKYAPEPRALTNGNEWHVFLSYRSVNRTWVLNLYDVLTELKFKVFIDQCEIVAGDLLISRLGNALDKSQSGVLIWSAAAADSEWVAQEYQTLDRKATTNKAFKFVPVKLDNTELPGFAANRVFVDFSSYPDGPNGGELLRLVHGIVGVPLSKEAAQFANIQNDMAASAFGDITAAILNKDPDWIMQLFKDGQLPWHTTAALGCKAAESLIKLGKYDQAIEILLELKQQFPKSIRPRQLHALALARRKSNDDLKDAQKILAKLYAGGERDPETLGIYGRTWMDRYDISKDPDDLRQSRNYYAQAFEKAPDDSYTGINAAAKSIFLGEIEKGNELAAKVKAIVGDQPVKGDYWKTATIAEVLLIQKEFKAAAVMYQNAVDIAPTEIGSLTSTWGQVKKLMEKLKPTEEERSQIANAFKNLPGFSSI